MLDSPGIMSSARKFSSTNLLTLSGYFKPANEVRLVLDNTCVGPQCGLFFQTAVDMILDDRASALTEMPSTNLIISTVGAWPR